MKDETKFVLTLDNARDHVWQRYYNTPAKDVSLDTCRRHGGDHRAYKWCPQIGADWSDEQILAYIDGYYSTDV